MAEGRAHPWRPQRWSVLAFVVVAGAFVPGLVRADDAAVVAPPASQSTTAIAGPSLRAAAAEAAAAAGGDDEKKGGHHPHEHKSKGAHSGGAPGGAGGGGGGGGGVAGIAGTAAPSGPVPNKPVNFYGVGLSLGLSDSSGLNAVGENYENDWLLYFLPSWKLGRLFLRDYAPLRDLTLSGRWLLSGEFSGVSASYRTGEIAPNAGYQGCLSAAPGAQGGLVNTGSVPYCQSGAQRRLDYSDIVLKLTDKVYQIPVLGISLTPGVASAIPVSAQSQYSHLITTLQGSVGLSRGFFGDRLIIGYGFAVTKFFHSTSVPVIDYTNDPIQDPNNPQLNTPGATSASSDLSRFADGAGGLVASYSVVHQVAATFSVNDKVSLTSLYVIGDTFKLPIPNCTTYLGAGVGYVNTCANGATVAQTQGATVTTGGDSGSQVFLINVSYQVNDYLSADVSLLTASPQRHPDGSWQEPFFTANYNAYSSANVGITLTTEALAASLRAAH